MHIFSLKLTIKFSRPWNWVVLPSWPCRPLTAYLRTNGNPLFFISINFHHVSIFRILYLPILMSSSASVQVSRTSSIALIICLASLTQQSAWSNKWWSLQVLITTSIINFSLWRKLLSCSRLWDVFTKLQ